MREVKVRAWHKILKEFVSPSRFLVIDADGRLCNDDVEILQFTGLTDKNGVEIYEGDILEDDEHFYYAISWSDKYHGWYASDIGGLDELPADSVVIGNIHQHPELLK